MSPWRDEDSEATLRGAMACPALEGLVSEPPLGWALGTFEEPGGKMGLGGSEQAPGKLEGGVQASGGSSWSFMSSQLGHCGPTDGRGAPGSMGSL